MSLCNTLSPLDICEPLTLPFQYRSTQALSVCWHDTVVAVCLGSGIAQFAVSMCSTCHALLARCTYGFSCSALLWSVTLFTSTCMHDPDIVTQSVVHTRHVSDVSRLCVLTIIETVFDT